MRLTLWHLFHDVIKIISAIIKHITAFYCLDLLHIAETTSGGNLDMSFTD